jgi:hypothetical protein
MLKNKKWNRVHSKLNSKWDPPKKDFLHFIAAGYAKDEE